MTGQVDINAKATKMQFFLIYCCQRVVALAYGVLTAVSAVWWAVLSSLSMEKCAARFVEVLSRNAANALTASAPAVSC